MPIWKICLPDYDEDFKDFESSYDGTFFFDHGHAAEEYAQHLCNRDNECYESFASGDNVIVISPQGVQKSFAVSMDMKPIFHSRILD